jgi:hypothetical protein
VLSRWDEEILKRVERGVLASRGDLAATVEAVVDELFDFFLEKRSWVTLTARATLGEGLAKGVSLQEQSWLPVHRPSRSPTRSSARRSTIWASC